MLWEFNQKGVKRERERERLVLIKDFFWQQTEIENFDEMLRVEIKNLHFMAFKK